MSEIMPILNLSTLAIFAALIVLSVLALTVTIFKVMQFRRMGVGRRAEAEAALDDWLNGRPDQAITAAGQGRSVLTRVLAPVMEGLRARPGDTTYAEELGRQSALEELAALNGRMRLLEAVVQAAPMLGLLGTIIGMIDAFSALSLSQSAVDPALLANGIWTALTTTAIGLAIALLTYFAANWLEARIEAERQRMEMIIPAAILGRVGLSGRR
ncbi:MAG: MotA/TolQ/ExbB proton channel family protein [Paracoccus sp. (in: a-proteobacteria)]|uniref:MotA/TolQ/ExbB proton channel family protein n=1 Tax=Paracoccus sp. TaxID=267 RepID=UPI0026DEEE72|nr:MotA/TolQ/ExbB proton channel family protein [Paracoccus sp. (in: a-proteobacteria)]MDO5612949.1 MotA/TolQ/ExbB proton channel family protein [Paracoccus sp. (in: a-proteobacteria)]